MNDPEPRSGQPPAVEMALEDRLRRDLHRRARGISTRGDAAAITRAARRRTRRARAAGATAAVVVLTGAGAVIGSMGGSDDDPVEVAVTSTDDNDVTSPAAITAQTPRPDTQSDDSGVVAIEPPPAATPTTPTAGTEETQITGSGRRSPVLDLAVVGNRALALSEAGGVSTGRVGHKLRPLEIPTGNEGDVALDLSEANGRVHITGTADAGWWVRRSTDLRRWTEMKVPDVAELVVDDELVEHSVTALTVGDGPAGPIVTGQIEHRLRIERILPAEVVDAQAYTIGDGTGALPTIVVYDTESGEVVDEVPLAGLGLDDETIDLILRGGTSPQLAMPGRRAQLVDRSGDLPENTTLSSPSSTAHGWFAAGFSSRFGERVLWRSANGRRWEPLALSAPAAHAGAAVVEAGNRLVAFTAQGPFLAVHWSPDGVSWTESDVSAGFPEGVADFAVVAYDGGPEGAAALVSTVDATGPTAWIIASRDGSTWGARRLDDVVPRRTAGSAGAIAVAGDQIVIAGATRTAAIDFAQITG